MTGETVPIGRRADDIHRADLRPASHSRQSRICPFNCPCQPNPTGTDPHEPNATHENQPAAEPTNTHSRRASAVALPRAGQRRPACGQPGGGAPRIGTRNGTRGGTSRDTGTSTDHRIGLGPRRASCPGKRTDQCAQPGRPRPYRPGHGIAPKQYNNAGCRPIHGACSAR